VWNFFNWWCVLFRITVRTSNEETLTPKTRVTIGLTKVKSCNALLRILMGYTRNNLKLVQRYYILSMDTHYLGSWSQWPHVGLRPIASWDCSFDSRRGNSCLSLVSIVCCQVELTASGWSHFQRSPTEGGVWSCHLDNEDAVAY